jgi:hypothetical protein
MIEPCAAAELLEGEGVGAGAAREARKAGLLAARHPAQEGLRGCVQPPQPIVQPVRVDGGRLRHLGTDGLHLGFRLEARDGDMAALPSGDALF